MATHTITVDDSTQAGARLLAIANDMAKLYEKSVTIKTKKKKLSGVAKSIDEGLKELKAVLKGEMEDHSIDELIEELHRDQD